MASNPNFPNHNITKDELKQRKNVIVFSNVGLHLRENLKEEQKLDAFLEKARHDEKSSSRLSSGIKLPEINSKNQHNQNQESISQLSQLSSKAHISLEGIKSKDRLINEIKKNIEIPSNQQYLNKYLDKMTVQIIKGKTPTQKNMHSISQKMINLHSKLDQINQLIEDKNIYPSKQKMRVNPLNQTIGTQQCSMIEEEEFQDRISSIAALEAKIDRMQAKLRNAKSIQMRVKQQVEETRRFRNHTLSKQLSEANVVKNFKIEDDLYGTRLNDRLQVRMFDYQRAKFEPIWKKQPPPVYTSKMALIEEEKKQKIQQQKELEEYELALKYMNSQ